MCCRGERCFRINCHCICIRCRKCDDCAKMFGKGGLAMALGSGALGALSCSIVKSGYRAKPPPPNPFLPPPPSTVDPAAMTPTQKATQAVPAMFPSPKPLAVMPPVPAPVATPTAVPSIPPPAKRTHGPKMVETVGESCTLQ